MKAIHIFFIKIKELNFWQRLFSWGALKSLSYEAYQEYKILEDRFSTATATLDTYKERNNSLEQAHQHVLEQLREAKTTLRSEEHTSELQSRANLVCRLPLAKKQALVTG